MEQNRKTVLLTGATGIMGEAGLKELLNRRDRFDIRLLVRPSARNRAKLEYLKDAEHVSIVWGDLTDYSNVFTAVSGTDYVLHVGGMVSPKADYLPITTRKVNVTSAENIVKAVLAQPNADENRVV